MSDDATTANGVRGWLVRAPNFVVVSFGIACSFGVYFSMYAFRKPFDAVTYESQSWLGGSIELKTACVVGQIFGYLLSKYLGTKYCSETPSRWRPLVLVGLILVALAALLCFALLPTQWKPLAMFVNGLPLGMVWGLVVRYLEGRRASEILVAGLSMSFIIAGAITKDIGRNLVIDTWQIDTFWMPATTGLLFLLPFVVCVWLLHQMPPPTVADQVERAHRGEMFHKDRQAFVKRYGFGFGLLLVAYFFLTAYRDFRDHYSAELFELLELDQTTGIFSLVETWGLVGSVLAMSALSLFRRNGDALLATFVVITMGYAIIGLSTLAFTQDLINGIGWMSIVGIGLYLAYVPYSAVLFERMMAGSRLAGTSVFAIQLADGIGYTGSVIIQLFRDILLGDANRLQFFVPLSFVVSVVGIALSVIAARRVISSSQD